jgi:hypothetical protein
MFCVRRTPTARPVREVIEDDFWADAHCDSAMEDGLWGSEA